MTEWQRGSVIGGCSTSLGREGELAVVEAMGLVCSTSWGLLGEPVVGMVRARVSEGGLWRALFPGGVVTGREEEGDRESVHSASQLVCIWCWILALSV